MTSDYRLSRINWYGAVVGAAFVFIVHAGTRGLDYADFAAGFLSAVLVSPFLLRESQERRPE